MTQLESSQVLKSSHPVCFPSKTVSFVSCVINLYLLYIGSKCYVACKIILVVSKHLHSRFIYFAESFPLDKEYCFKYYRYYAVKSVLNYLAAKLTRYH